MTKTKKTSTGDSLIHKQVVWKMSRLSRAMKRTSGLDEMMRSLLLSWLHLFSPMCQAPKGKGSYWENSSNSHRNSGCKVLLFKAHLAFVYLKVCCPQQI